MSPLQQLGLPESASKRDVSRAWLALAKQHHPDKGGSAEEFNKWNEVYKAAMVYSNQYISCTGCNGRGTYLIGKGFTKTSIRCKKCHGKGKYKRYKSS